jgi:antirestriction protein ArdC
LPRACKASPCIPKGTLVGSLLAIATPILAGSRGCDRNPTTIIEETKIMTDITNIYKRVTNKIISDLEKRTLPWQKPWNAKYGAHTSRPLHADRKTYRGINVLILWHAAFEEGYRNPYWMTYKHAKKLGGQVKKGEKGTSVVYTDKLTSSETNGRGEEVTS